MQTDRLQRQNALHLWKASCFYYDTFVLTIHVEVDNTHGMEVDNDGKNISAYIVLHVWTGP